MTRQIEPASAARRDEIIEEIIENLRPLKKTYSLELLEARIKLEISELHKLTPFLDSLGDRRKNREHARKLEIVLHELEDLLISAPKALLQSLFSPVTPPKSGNWFFEQKLPYNSMEEVQAASLARVPQFQAELKLLRRVCARAINPGLGTHPNYDHLKHACAYVARGLLSELSKQKVTGTEDAPFRTISSLFYEAASGQRDADLKRACDAVLHGEMGGTNPPI